MVSESIMLDKSKELAISIIELCKEIMNDRREYIFTKQLIRSGTPVGANIHEAQYAQSRADLISKLSIALKECFESEYWLELLYKTKYITDEKVYKKFLNNYGRVRRMLIASITTNKKIREKEMKREERWHW